MNKNFGNNNETFVYTRQQDTVFPSKKNKNSTEAPPPYEQTIAGKFPVSDDNDDTFNYPVPSNFRSSPEARTQMPPLVGVTLVGKVYIWYFWDIENVQLSKRFSSIEVHNIVDAIRSLCKDFFPGARVNHMNFRVVTASEDSVPSTIKDALVRKTVEFYDRPGQAKAERADKDILRLMFDTVFDNFEKKDTADMAFVLITGDGDYMDFLESLKKKDIIPILIHKDNANKEIKNSAKHLIHWNQVLARAGITNKETNTPVPEIKSLNIPPPLPFKDIDNMKNKNHGQIPKINVPPEPKLKNKETSDQLPIPKLSKSQSAQKPKNVSSNNGKKETNDQSLKPKPSKSQSAQKPKDANSKKETDDQKSKLSKSLLVEKPKDANSKKETNDQKSKLSKSLLVEKPEDATKKPYIVIHSLAFSVTESMVMRWFPKAINCEFTTEGHRRTAHLRFNHEKDAMEWVGQSPVFDGFKLDIRKGDKSLDLSKSTELPVAKASTSNLSKGTKPCITIFSLSFSVTEDMLMRWFPKAISCEFIATEGNRRNAYLRFNHENEAAEWAEKSPVFEGFKLDIKKMDKPLDVGKSQKQPAFFTVGLSNEKSQTTHGVSEAIFQYMEKHIDQIEKIKAESNHLILYKPINVKKFVFEGPPAEISKVADKINDLVCRLKEVQVPREHPFNKLAANLFITHYLQNLEREWDVSLSVVPSGDDRVLEYDVTIVGPKAKPGVRQASAIIHDLNLLDPVVIKLDSDQLQCLKAPHDKGSSKLDIIADKHTIICDIVDRSPSCEIVLYAFSASNLASAKEAIEQIIVAKRSVSVQKGIFAHAIRFHTTEIDTIRLRNDSVTIAYPWSVPPKEKRLKQIAEAPNEVVSISFSGPPKKVSNVAAGFKKLIDSVNLVSEVFRYPHSRRWQARHRFESIKKTVEEEGNVSIFLHFKENTNVNTNDGNQDASQKGDKSVKDKGSPILGEMANTATREQSEPLIITVTAVGPRSTAKDALAKFYGIHFNAKCNITVGELNKNGRQMHPLIVALDPPKNVESSLQNYLYRELNVGYYFVPRSCPNHLEIIGENEEVLRAAKEKIFHFLSGIGGLTGSEKPRNVGRKIRA